MTKILFKSNCRIKELTPFLWCAFSSLTWLARDEEFPVETLTITSVYDGVHSKNSKHYIGQALDIRSKNFPSAESKRAFMANLQEDLQYYFGPITILLEDEGGPNEHIHVQVKKS